MIFPQIFFLKKKEPIQYSGTNQPRFGSAIYPKKNMDGQLVVHPTCSGYNYDCAVLGKC